MLPGLAGGAALTADVGVSARVGLTFGARFFPHASTALDGWRFSFGLTAASAGGCYDLAAGRAAALRGCASVVVGAVGAASYDLQGTTPAQRLWVGVRASRGSARSRRQRASSQRRRDGSAPWWRRARS